MLIGSSELRTSHANGKIGACAERSRNTEPPLLPPKVEPTEPMASPTCLCPGSAEQFAQPVEY